MLEFGFGVTTDPETGQELHSPGPGELAWPCALCPRANVNLPDGWEKDPNRFRYAPVISVDGNFTADQIRMENEEHDTSITDGTGFWVERDPFMEYLPTAMKSNSVRILFYLLGWTLIANVARPM